MRIPRFFIHEKIAAGRVMQLEKNTSHHIMRVLRMKVADHVVIFNEFSGEWLAEIILISRQYIEVKIIDQIKMPESVALKISIGQCISRGDRMDYAIQKATEVGVHAVYPLYSRYCEVKLDQERTAKKQAHWQNLAMSAAEQSGRLSVPHVFSPQEMMGWAEQCHHQHASRFVLDPQAKKTFSDFSLNSTVFLLIGPEGGLSPTEINDVQCKGFHPVSLGKQVLRTETAPVVAIAILNFLWTQI